MKNKLQNKFFILTIFLLSLAGCANKKQEITTPQYIMQKSESGQRLAFASDLHIGAQESGNISFEGDFSPEILDAFADDLKENQVDFLILCGDISNSSRYDHHAQLVEKLAQIEENGTQVLVIDGNHDIGKMTAEEFDDFYVDFGYGDAVSRDEDSLSYAYLAGNTLIVLLDTDGYTDYRYANLSDETLKWLEDTLAFANENGYTVLTIGHYPILTTHTTEFLGREKALDILKKYGVPLYICGHLHNRNVTVKDGLCELTIEQLTSYPCNYGIVDIDTEGNISYKPEKLNVSQWAKNNGIDNELILNFEQMGEQSAQRAYENLIETLCKTNFASPSEKKKRMEFYALLTECRTEGTLYANKEILLSHPGCQIFMRICQGSNYAPWIPSLFENANPYTAGFVIQQGEISPIN